MLCLLRLHAGNCYDTNNIVSVFKTYAESDKIGTYACCNKLFIGKLSVS